MTDVRTEPGIELLDLFITTAVTTLAVWTGGAFWLALAIWLWFSAIVAKGFYPYLSDEQIIELRRQMMMEEYENKEEDDNSGDLREGPPEDQD